MDEAGRGMTGKKIVLLACSTMTVMAAATISPSLPEMQRVFAGAANLELLISGVVTVTALAIALGAPLAGAVIDRFGRRKLLIISLAAYGFAGSSGLLLDSLAAIIVGRAMLGLAVAGLMVCTTTLVADYFQGSQRTKFIGLQVACMNLGGVVFIVLGGFLAGLHWRAPFTVYLLSFILIPAVYRLISETHQSRAAQGGPTAAAPAVPWSGIIPVYLAGLFGWAVFFLIPLKLPFFLANFKGSSPAIAGLTIGFWSVIGTITSASFGRIARRLDFRIIFALLFAISGAGFLLLAMAGSYAMVLTAMGLCGFGFGLLMPNINLRLMELAPLQVRGRVLGGMTSSNFLGQFMAPILALPALSAGGLTGAWGAYGVNGMLALVLGLSLLAGRVFRLGKR